MPPARTCMLLLLFWAAALLPVAWAAGCRRVRAKVTHKQQFFNHQATPKWHPHDLPANFSWNDVNGTGRSLLVPSWNQHIPQYCGSCWLHGTTSMIQDRLKIAKDGLGPDTMLARQVVLNCGAFHGYGQGCGGGDVIDVLRYMAAFGLPDESCQPYSATDHTKYGRHARKCPGDAYCTNCMPLKSRDTCWPVHTPVRYFLSSFGKLEEPGEAAMLAEIYSRGPITCSMATPEAFDYGYHSGVAVFPPNISDPSEIDHDVEVVGWGEELDGLKYWLIRNSWGTYWGELGFFKLQRGVNSLQLEAGDCWYAIPTWQDERDVRAGVKVGSMWGIFPREEAAQIKPEGHRHPHYKRGQAALAAWLAVCVRRRRAGGGTAGYVGLLFILLSRMSQGVFMHQGVKAAAQFSAISAFAQSLIAHHLLTSINQTPITMQAHAAFLSGSAALPRPATQRQARTQRQGRAATHVMAYMTKEHSSANLQQSVLRLHEAMNKHDITQLSHFLAPAVVLSDRVWSSIDVRGIVKVRRIYQELWTAYPDYSVHVEDVLARDDSHTVAVHFAATGTNFGEWRGNPASGRRTTMSGMSLFVFEPEGDDQIKQIITYRQPSSEEYILYLGHEDL